ncbi:MAG: chromate resistance protein [Desulfovibrio sp.]|nr:chromate resistance protein [Desulfovibrio sp.]MBI4959634.1 chromate resistance protein [Desulfovibrio sp.]
MSNDKWLFFSFSLPAKNQSGRMRVWRRLTGLGAVIIKNAFYVLPVRADLHEQLLWLVKEVEGLGGEALFLETAPPANMCGEDIALKLTQARDADWQTMEQELLPLLDQARQPASDRAHLEAAHRRLGKRAGSLRDIDYFPSGRGARVEGLVAELALLLSGEAAPNVTPTLPALSPENFKGAVWVTRERPYIDRLASFWLVRRYLDPDAAIAFVPAEDKPAKKVGTVRFDMADAEFTHVGSLTTFEVLCESFRLTWRIPSRFREVIRAIDLNELETGPAEAPGVKQVLDGFVHSIPGDALLVEQTLALFDALLASYSQTNGEQQ